MDKITVLVHKETTIDDILKALQDLETKTDTIEKTQEKAKQLTLMLKD